MLSTGVCVSVADVTIVWSFSAQNDVPCLTMPRSTLKSTSVQQKRPRYNHTHTQSNTYTHSRSCMDVGAHDECVRTVRESRKEEVYERERQSVKLNHRIHTKRSDQKRLKRRKRNPAHKCIYRCIILYHSACTHT